MRVTTPLADVDMTIGTLLVDGNTLVMSNASSDAMRTRTVLSPQDVRQLLKAFLRPSVLWFALMCLCQRDSADGFEPGRTEQHPTPDPW